MYCAAEETAAAQQAPADVHVTVSGDKHAHQRRVL